MNKKFKFTSAILSAGLLITPVSGLVNNYSNVAKANYKINNRKVKQEITFSDYDVFKEFKKAYENKELNITEKQFKEIEANIQSRGYWGENKIVEFEDEAIDVYISGFVLTVVSGYGSAKLLAYIPKLAQFSDVLGALSGGFLGGFSAMNNGIIVYFATYWGPTHIKNSPTGKYGYIKYYSHWRHQQ